MGSDATSSDSPVVVILHGFGTTADDMVPLCAELQIPSCLFVLPDGPLRVDRMPGARAWYDRFTHSRKDVERSRDYLFEVMDHFSKGNSEAEEGKTLKPRPVVIMGFSQGAVMSLEAGLNYKGAIKAVVSMSGYMGHPELTMAHPKAPRKTDILMVHGTLDPVVQDEDTQITLSALRKAGYHPVLREFMMGHKITAATVRTVSDFLQKVLGPIGNPN